jgi:hypothetical protein
VFEEGPNEGFVTLDLLHGIVDSGIKILGDCQRLASEQPLEVAPDVFIGVHVGRIAGKEVNSQTGMLEDEPARGGSDVSWMLVEHKIDRSPDVVQKRLEKLDEELGGQVALEPRRSPKSSHRRSPQK